MAIDFDRRLDAAITSFVADIRELARGAALAAVADAFADGAAAPRTPVRPAAPSRSNGAKRSPREMAATVGRLEKYVQTHPGERIEQIARALGVASRELQLPARKLRSTGQLRTEGQKRATRYFVG